MSSFFGIVDIQIDDIFIIADDDFENKDQKEIEIAKIMIKD